MSTTRQFLTDDIAEKIVPARSGLEVRAAKDAVKRDPTLPFGEFGLPDPGCPLVCQSTPPFIGKSAATSDLWLKYSTWN